MFEFRSKQLKLPTQKDQAIILGKYEATEKRLEQLVEEVSVADCAIKRIELFQNQMNDPKIRLLCDAIKSNSSVTTVKMVKCRLRTSQLVDICTAIREQESKSIQELHLN